MAIPTKTKSLKHGRPPLLSSASSGISKADEKPVNARNKSSKATRGLINNFHNLQKRRACAEIDLDETEVERIDQLLEGLGGLKAYQAASLTGQDKERGGDSSEKLVEWLYRYRLVGKQRDPSFHPLRCFEVGSLSSKNAISAMVNQGVDCVDRIDLHSQEPDKIIQGDFMTHPIPEEGYDVLSLSLVLNFVPDPAQRGRMLRRTVQFLRCSNFGCLPLLFLVLPLPCLDNSRYMTQQTLENLMESCLGYTLLEAHESTKLVYLLFKLTTPAPGDTRSYRAFRKSIVNPGSVRNNFAIVLEPGTV